MKLTTSLSLFAAVSLSMGAQSSLANEIVDLGQAFSAPQVQPQRATQPLTAPARELPPSSPQPTGQYRMLPTQPQPQPRHAAPGLAPQQASTRQEASAPYVADAEAIRTVQRGLTALGFNPGPVDGKIGQQTIAAIRSFEKANGLQSTGQISAGLVRLMASVKPQESTGSASVAQQESACSGTRCQVSARSAPVRNKRTPSHEQTQPAKTEPVIEAVNRWFGRSTGVMVENGLVRFPYGQMEPVLVCAPLRVCTVELQEGEQVINVAIGDSARWELFPAATGQTTIVGVKTLISELDPDVTTNALITTDRRVYTIILKTSKNDFVPRIGFYYPQDAVQSWARREDIVPSSQGSAGQSGGSVRGAAPAAPATADEGLQVDLSRVDSNYSIEGSRDASWRPTQVFDDGRRLYIGLPHSMTEMPAVFVDDRIVNFRVRSGYLVVDKLGKTTTLLYGVGRNQQRVDIVKGRGHSRNHSSNDGWFGN